MVDQSPVRGCMIIRPWGMAIWDILRNDLDARIRETGTENAYFPLFIPKSFLSKEAEHVDGFAKECAVVTHHRLTTSPDGSDLIPDPSAELDEPLVVRPTSETVIWQAFSRWIGSHRDLPLKLNQWANVVRWEMRTRPFLRSSEFLWQEGHTAHATSEEAIMTAREALDMYESVCKELLAMPVIKGVKSKRERFAGADDTYTIEALMQNGLALQSGTSHYLGQNFARAFDVYFQTEKETRELVWATSWGVSTRLIGGLVMIHSDDKGLVLPPPVAPLQVVIVPISKGSGEGHEIVMSRVDDITLSLKKNGVRYKIDDRAGMRPGAKYFEWERKGVPIRVDIGERDVASNTVTVSLRDTGEKTPVPFTSSESLSLSLSSSLSEMTERMYERAKERQRERTYSFDTYAEMKAHIEKTGGERERERESDEETEEERAAETEKENDKERERERTKAGFYLVPWHADDVNEEKIKTETRATIRCYPLAHNLSPPIGVKCFYSGKPATHYALFARAY
eukprot:CAMPEP_0182426600 /NCGR_PEP_ID=MMETSP1167-20130531/13110_1 /TAXON_ID=2988 /ORGANISM="Mallomonas Sp, Strain CCMP3275" /LENGTH=510 /DNA_ID=CAMNT_0024608165 /DNA_START=323 /DNA_END=1855 /DNA_ORIENTATION=+